VEAAPVPLKRMGVSPADLVAAPASRPTVPTFAEYVPVVSAAVSAGTRRAYGTYWNRIVEHWGDRRLDEPTRSDIRQLMAWVKDPRRDPPERPGRAHIAEGQRTCLDAERAEQFNDGSMAGAEGST
jgi:hypothetical protein